MRTLRFLPPTYTIWGLMSTRDFETYHNIFDLMGKLIQAPDLIIYLRASIHTLVNQIQKRGRDYENTIRLDYLKQLNQRYEAWASRYLSSKILIINVDELNFAESKEDLSKVIDRIDARLHGLF